MDEHGMVQESQCECPVGMGPGAHCKHVAVVLLALTKVKEGIVTKETCTQVLQTFHQTKKYNGSPVKMADLKLHTHGAMASLQEFDPRPEELRNTVEYPHHFRNVWLNSRAENVSIRQLYKPANVYAISNDHGYLEKSHEDYFLEKMEVTCITQSQKEDVERKTLGQSSNKKWKEERTKRLQSSNFGKICKAGDKMDKGKLARSFTQCLSVKAKAIDHGKKYEAVALDFYGTNTGLKIQSTGIHVNMQYPFLGCSPDGLVGNDRVVEVKCPYTAKDMKIAPGTLPYLYRDQDGKLHLRQDHDYYFQVQGTLLCTGREFCDFVVWTLADAVIITIQRNNGFIESMIQRLGAFFEDHFKQAVLQKYMYKNTDKYAFC